MEISEITASDMSAAAAWVLVVLALLGLGVALVRKDDTLKYTAGKVDEILKLLKEMQQDHAKLETRVFLLERDVKALQSK